MTLTLMVSNPSQDEVKSDLTDSNDEKSSHNTSAPREREEGPREALETGGRLRRR